ncbi:fasciclin domain-containing protein [Oryzibacter oryziterrae]|uniref:fasciclin domain-containing protein n=1 Tax=Oryzibacter oryziterrae TaxID=2766474 RepID=UPI001F45E5BD|nr:fasciclin domain-containing protein [Oryzibacter oryziterrae]
MFVRIAKATAAAVLTVSLIGAATAPSWAEDTVMVGGAPMYPSKTIVENAVNSKDHTTLVAAVKAAGLVDTLNSAGPFTVFAPTNEAFAALPAGTVDTLLKPENKDKLVKVLTYHVIPGKMTAEDLMAKIKKMDGKLNLDTVAGDPITLEQKGKHLYVIDETGAAAEVTIADVLQSNGVIHVINKVLLPK